MGPFSKDEHLHFLIGIEEATGRLDTSFDSDHRSHESMAGNSHNP